jgi:hypothetical protein
MVQKFSNGFRFIARITAASIAVVHCRYEFVLFLADGLGVWVFGS